MKKYPIAAFAIITFVSGGFVTAALTQPVSTPPPPAEAPPQAATANPGPDQVFAPGFDDIMTMLVQPRHAKLYYAGVQKNWELAAAEMRDLRGAFDRLAQAIPNYQGNDVDAAVTALMVPKMRAVDDAIATADSKKFVSAYNGLTEGCNACHTYMEHPFFVIKVPGPAASAYPNQEFGTPRVPPPAR